MWDFSEFFAEAYYLFWKKEGVAAGDQNFFDSGIVIDVFQCSFLVSFGAAEIFFRIIVFAKTKAAIGKTLVGEHKGYAVEVHSLQAGNAGVDNALEGFSQASIIFFSGVRQVLFGNAGVFFDLGEEVGGEVLHGGKSFNGNAVRNV